MVKEHLLLREYSGKPWSHGSLAREYLEKLPLANAEENFRETDTRYLLPRTNIFTFGLQNGITERVIYYTCKMCHAFVKPHDVKNHMITRHPKQDGATGSSSQTASTHPSSSKSKKSSHKSKKKVMPPPSVPPPPLFPKVEFPPPSTVSSTSSSEDLLPPVLQPVQAVDTKISSSHRSSQKNDALVTSIAATITVTATTTVVTAASSASATAPLGVPVTTVTVTPATTTITSSSNLPPTLPVEVSTKKSAVAPPTVSASKTRERSSKSEKESSRRKRSKRSRNSNDYDPNKHCGVLDFLKRPCMRALTCANHTIIERRAVSGRSKNIDKLILEYKASRVKNKPQPVLPISIAPKQCSALKEARNGLRVIELIYENDNQNDLAHSDFKCPDDPIMSSVFENLASITHRVPKAIKPSSTFYVPPSPELEHVARATKLSPGTFLKVNLSQSSPPLPGSKVAEVPSQTPTLYSAHPKPMTMLTTPLRRVGSSFVLQQQAQRLDRQRLDLQAVVNQHKQLKVASSNKQVSLLNSNYNKQSILKSNVKNNAKANPVKRPAVEKASVNDTKHMKAISADMNGFILNTDFVDNNETQLATVVQDKIALLK